MQSDIIAKIDALVRMSDSTLNANTMKVELRELDLKIREKRKELQDLKSSISDDKYFDASSEIVDKNIEISLNKKIKMLSKSLAEIKAQMDMTKAEEDKYFHEIEELKKTILEEENFIQVLETKISSLFVNYQENFKELLQSTQSKLKEDKKSLEKKEKAYQKIQGKMEVLCFSKTELENKIQSESEKLMETKACLLNKRGYVNSELKKEDQEKIEALETEIAELSRQKYEILSDPVMIAEEAKNFLIDDDKTSALNKIKELKEIILKIPYMDIDTKTSKDTLVIELENAEAKRDDFASMINSKNYESVDATLIKDRISYIKDRKEKLLKEIEEITVKVKEADTNDLEDLNNRINYCENEVENLKTKIEEYEKTLENNELSPSKKSTLQAAYDKKQEEYNNVVQLLNAYKNDRQELIKQSYELEITSLNKINAEIKNIEEEVKRLERLCISSNKAKDVIAIENDKKILKELNDTVKAIKRRQTFKETPSEIYDEIEILLGTGFNESIKPVEEPKDLEVEKESIEVQEPIIEESHVENNVESSIQNALEENIDIDTLPIIDEDEIEEVNITNINEDNKENEKEEEKIKVIHVEPINEEESSSNNDFLIGDYNKEE